MSGYSLLKKNLTPRALNLAKDIVRLAEKIFLNEVVSAHIESALKELKKLLEEEKDLEKYFLIELISLRKLLLKAPNQEVEWSKRFSTENEAQQLCDKIKEKIVKLRAIIAEEKNNLESEEKKVAKHYEQFDPNSYIQIGIDLKNKIRCVSFEPNESVAHTIKRSRDLKVTVLEIAMDLEKNENLPEDIKKKVRKMIRSCIFCLSINSLAVLDIRKYIYELKEVLKTYPFGFDLIFKVRRIGVHIDRMMHYCDIEAALDKKDLEKIEFDREVLNQKLRQGKVQMWPYIGTVQQMENDPLFSCVEHARLSTPLINN